MNRTYRKLWQQRPALTSIGNFNLRKFGIRITLDGMIAFVVCLIPARLLQPMISGLSAAITGRPMSPVLVILGLASIGAWASTKIDAQGKPLPLFVLDLIRYIVRPHRTNGWTPVKFRKPIKIKHIAKHHIRRTTPLQ